MVHSPTCCSWDVIESNTASWAEVDPIQLSSDPARSALPPSRGSSSSTPLFLSSSFSSCSVEMKERASTSVAAVYLPSSSDRSASSALHLDVKEGMESDEEIRRVPESGGESAGTSASGRDTGSGVVRVAREGQRKRRGRNPADRESKRLKRLLRNRVSAQQARERKKAYLSDLETRVKESEKKSSELQERLSTLQNENQMLRQILKNTTASRISSGNCNNADGSL